MATADEVRDALLERIAYHVVSATRTRSWRWRRRTAT